MLTQNVYGLTDNEIREVCPSVFAESAHQSRSSRYGYIPTSDVLASLRDAGLVPTTAQQALARSVGREEYTKHLLRLRKRDDLGKSKPDVHEVVLINSHDGSSVYSLMSGIFRQACTNGLVTGDIDTTLKVRHTTNAPERVVEGTLRIIEEGEEIMEQVAAMKEVELSREEQLLLAEFALKVRYDADDEDEIVFQPEDILRPRRKEDRANDLYTTHNVIQEHVTRGGVSRRDAQGKRHTIRAVKGIDESIKVNQRLWLFTQRMLALKTQ